MKVILVDDEPTMHLILRKMLIKLPEVQVQVVGSFTDTRSAASFLQENADIGLAFVDISMPGESGLEFAAKLEASGSKVKVVFVTSHKEYAVKAYELSVLDYLVKPVSQERLQRTVNRVLNKWIMTPALATEDSENGGRVVLTMLGDVVISNESGRVKWISRKCAELFAYLVLYRGKRIPRSRLIKDIFGGMHQVSALKYLNTTVYQLRKSLEQLGLRGVVQSENDGYTIELKDPIIDYVEFERQIAKLQNIDSGNVAQAQQIERLYTGDLFGDKAYVWAIHETERYAELYASFVKRIASALISMGETTLASKQLIELKQRNPLDESVIQLLMTIREMTGDKKGLTALYTDYVRLLSRELGIRPSEELIQLYDSLITHLSDKK